LTQGNHGAGSSQGADAVVPIAWRVRAINWHDIVLVTGLPLRQARKRSSGGVEMAAPIRHVAINADDVQRAKAFYESVFGWSLEPWGPPDYYSDQKSGGSVIIALHGRREFAPGVRMLGFEATMAVDDIAATIAAVEAAGGRTATTPVYIEGVGKLVYFQDPDGNVFGAMQYDPDPH
jgi:predicted enzyme related to lactoylglutathione lyase